MGFLVYNNPDTLKCVKDEIDKVKEVTNLRFPIKPWAYWKSIHIPPSSSLECKELKKIDLINLNKIDH